MAATSIDFGEFGAHAPGRATCLVLKHFWLRFPPTAPATLLSRSISGGNDAVEVRGSEAVLVLFNKEDVYGL